MQYPESKMKVQKIGKVIYDKMTKVIVQSTNVIKLFTKRYLNLIIKTILRSIVFLSM